MTQAEIDRVLEAQHSWVAAELAGQLPRLGLDRLEVREAEGRRAARELVGMIVDGEAAALGVSFRRVEIRDQRTRWGSCSALGTLSFNWRLVLAPFEVLDYVVVHELCHLRQPNHSPQFWRLVASRRPQWRLQRAWLREFGPELLAFRAAP
jgi:predicted metal-dependent hydrolase